MEVRSVYRQARISPLKARDVARAIQGLPVSAALDALAFTPRKAAALVSQTLKSAIANAENNHSLAVESLVVKEATVGKGPAFRRFKARARGAASPIRKPTSHIRIILSDEIELPEPRTRGGKGKAKKKKASKPARAAAPESAPKKKKDEKPSSAEDEAKPEAAAAGEDEAAAAAPDLETPIPDPDTPEKQTRKRAPRVISPKKQSPEQSPTAGQDKAPEETLTPEDGQPDKK